MIFWWWLRFLSQEDWLTRAPFAAWASRQSKSLRTWAWGESGWWCNMISNDDSNSQHGVEKKMCFNPGEEIISSSLIHRRQLFDSLLNFFSFRFFPGTSSWTRRRWWRWCAPFYPASCCRNILSLPLIWSGSSPLWSHYMMLHALPLSRSRHSLGYHQLWDDSTCITSIHIHSRGPSSTSSSTSSSESFSQDDDDDAPDFQIIPKGSWWWWWHL